MDAWSRARQRAAQFARCVLTTCARVTLFGVTVLGVPAALMAQSTDFLLSTAPIAFPTPTLANYSSWPASAVGPVTDSVAVPYAVDRTGQSHVRVTTVLIRCTSVSGGKACSDIEWRNGPTGAWRALTVSDEVVEERTVIPGQLNDPWFGTLWLRVRLDWNDPAPAVMTSGIALTLSVYRP
jgi:hypothetical protein